MKGISQDIVIKSTVSLFESLDQAGLRYALLRNYDNFPVFGHDIDLVMHEDDINKFRHILLELAQENSWTYLTECRHWNKSNSKHHTIEVFRFFSIEPLAYLQIDLFHGYCLWGLPLLSEKELLEGCISDERGFKRIDPVKENFFRLLQINHASNGASERVKRYTEKVLLFSSDNLNKLSNYSCSKGLADVDLAIQALQESRVFEFKKIVFLFKQYFFLKSVLKNPISAMLNLYNRIISYLHAYFLDPCGAILNVYVTHEGQKNSIEKALGELSTANLLYSWTAGNANKNTLSLQERLIVERGGLALKWTKDFRRSTLKIVGENDNSQHLREEIVRFLATRHEVIYERRMTS